MALRASPLVMHKLPEGPEGPKKCPPTVPLLRVHSASALLGSRGGATRPLSPRLSSPRPHTSRHQSASKLARSPSPRSQSPCFAAGQLARATRPPVKVADDGSATGTTGAEDVWQQFGGASNAPAKDAAAAHKPVLGRLSTTSRPQSSTSTRRKRRRSSASSLPT